jgi:hypothetical protein
MAGIAPAFGATDVHSPPQPTGAAPDTGVLLSPIYRRAALLRGEGRTEFAFGNTAGDVRWRLTESFT